VSIASEIVGRLMRLPAPQTREVVVERDLEVPMDDGVVLLADRWAPRGQTGLPTLLVRSPYGRSGPFGVLYGRLFAERGFQVVIQSVRGTFGSGGVFNPFDERADGLATIAWLERQPWHTPGRLGMTGPSYLGLTQWAVASEANGSIGALTPQVTASQFHGQAYAGGGVSLDSALSWLLILGLQERRLGLARIPIALRRRLPALRDHLPLGEMDELLGFHGAAYFGDWLEHSAADDPYWAQRDNSAGIGDVEAPVQLVGGWYDIFLPWLLEDYAGLKNAGRDPQLIVGPWAHTSPGLAVRGTREALGWLRAHLLGDDRLISDAPVRIRVTGADEWRDLTDWPPPGAQPRRLHLQPGGRLDDAAPPESPPDVYTYDPRDPTPALGGPALMEVQPVADNRVLEARPDVVTYTTAPLPDDLEAIGPVEADVYVRSSSGFFDVFVRVCDVHPDERSLNVCDALVRVTPDDFEHGPDGSTRVRFPLWPTAHRFGAGHRIRVQVSSGAHPRYARNPGTGEPPATATRLVNSEQGVLHDPAHPSAVTLSVVPVNS
jgi:hypothetical protein